MNCFLIFYRQKQNYSLINKRVHLSRSYLYILLLYLIQYLYILLDTYWLQYIHNRSNTNILYEDPFDINYLVI